MNSRGLLEDSVCEALSGILSRSRTLARMNGVIEGRMSVRTPLSEVLDRVKTRVEGLRGKDGFSGDLVAGEIVQSIHIDVPTQAELLKLLASMGVKVVGDSVVLDVVIPPPRRAHAR